MFKIMHYRWRFKVWSCKAEQKGWRQQLGRALRLLAQKVDGRTSFCLEYGSTPSLTVDQLSACFDRGFKVMETAIEQEVRHEALDHALRKLAPALYADTVK